MYRFVNYMQNYVGIKISGQRPYKFINICLKRRIALWNIERISENEFSLCMFAGDFRKNVRAVALKSHVRVHITYKKGVKYSLKKMIARRSFIAALIMTTCLFCLLSSVVWRIDIEGADAALRVSTRALLGEMGIKRGMFMSDVNVKAVSSEILGKDKRLSWVGVRKHGTTLTVELDKASFYKEKESEDIKDGEPRDIAVSKDCQLYKITVVNGAKLQNEGSAVLSGETVISGEGGCAEGTVQGIVRYKAEAKVSESAEMLRFTGRSSERTSLLLFGLKIDLPAWGRNKGDFTSYDSFYTEKYLINDSVPIGTGHLVMKETAYEKAELSREEAEMKAKTDTETMLDAVIPDDAEILATYGCFTEKDGALYYTAEAEVLENVGVYVKSPPEKAEG